MANEEHDYANAADLRATNLLNREILELLHDPTDLRSVCTFVPHPLSGALDLKVPQIQRSYGMSAPGEQTTVGLTAITDASFTLTPARRALRIQETDLVQFTRNGSLDVDGMAAILAYNYGIDFTDQLAVLFASLSNSVGGGAAVDLTVDDIYDAIYQLNTQSVPGPFYCVLATHSWNEFQNSLRGESGALQFNPATQEALRAKGPGYKGSWMGVEFFSIDSVVDAGTTMDNAMFGAGCFAYTEADVSKIAPFVDRRISPVVGSPVLATTAWDDDKAVWMITASGWNAVAEAEDARGVLISTDDA